MTFLLTGFSQPSRGIHEASREQRPGNRCQSLHARAPQSQRLSSAERATGKSSATSINAAAVGLVNGPELDLAKMEPLGDRILVKPAEAASTTEGGLIVAPSTSGGMGIQDAVIGEVLAVGTSVDVKVKKGDRIIYSKYSTSDVSVPDGEVTFVAQKSVLATLA